MEALEVITVLRRDVRLPVAAPVIDIDVKIWCPSLPPTNDHRAKVLNLQNRGLTYFIRREKQPSSDINPIFVIERSWERDWAVFKDIYTALRTEHKAILFPDREYLCGLYVNTLMQIENMGTLIDGEKPSSFL